MCILCFKKLLSILSVVGIFFLFLDYGFLEKSGLYTSRSLRRTLQAMERQTALEIDAMSKERKNSRGFVKFNDRCVLFFKTISHNS